MKYKYRRSFLFYNPSQIESFLSIIEKHTKNIVTFGETVIIEDEFSFELCRKITNFANQLRLKDPYAIEKSGLDKENSGDQYGSEKSL